MERVSEPLAEVRLDGDLSSWSRPGNGIPVSDCDCVPLRGSEWLKVCMWECLSELGGVCFIVCESERVCASDYICHYE